MIHFMSEAAREVLDNTVSQVQWHQGEAKRLAQAAFNVACTLAGIDEEDREGYSLTLVDGKLALVKEQEETDEGESD